MMNAEFNSSMGMKKVILKQKNQTIEIALLLKWYKINLVNSI